MSTKNIELSVKVNASAETLWQLLTDHSLNRQWADAFYEGTYVETDWQIGSEVRWYAGNHELGAKGRVVANKTASLLKVAYYDDLNAASTDPLGEYVEEYHLSEEDGHTTFTIKAGPLPEEHYVSHLPLWQKALEKITDLAEKR